MIKEWQGLSNAGINVTDCRMWQRDVKVHHNFCKDMANYRMWQSGMWQGDVQVHHNFWKDMTNYRMWQTRMWQDLVGYMKRIYPVAKRWLDSGSQFKSTPGMWLIRPYLSLLSGFYVVLLVHFVTHDVDLRLFCLGVNFFCVLWFMLERQDKDKTETVKSGMWNMDVS